MKLIINNVQSVLSIGGRDHLVDADLMQHFRDYLSIKVPGSYFANKFLKYHWDGVKFFITPKGKFATGFLPVFLAYVEEEYPTLDVEIIDERGIIPEFLPVFQPEIGNRVINEQYVHQKHVIEAFNNWITFRGQKIYFPRGVADASTNAGKTSIIAGIYLNLATTERMLIIIHRKTIYRELLAYYQSLFGEIGQINDGHYKVLPVTLAMIQTLAKRIEDPNVKKDLSSFSVLAVDESHRAGSTMYTKTLVHCPAPIRIFVSGSAFDSKDVVSNMIIVGLSGKKLIKVSKKELMDKGISTPIKVKIHLCNTILRAPVLKYDECVEKLIHKSMERASIMFEIIRKRINVGPILIAVEETEHGKFLMETLNSMHKSAEVFEKCNIALTHSKDPDLVQKVEAFRIGEIDVLISTSVLREGVNLPLIQTVIYAVGGHSGVYIRQWMGRGERIDESKTETEFHDFYDIGQFVGPHSLHRLKMYAAEELEVQMDFDKKDLRRMTNVVIN
jgi:superfamily II DNA or RNA helicase